MPNEALSNQEQIYDIKPIPSFPYEPSLLAWSGALLFILLLFLLSRGVLARKPKYEPPSSWRRILAKLDELSAPLSPKDQQFQLLLGEIKRFLGLKLEYELESATPSEIALVAGSRFPSHADLLNLLAQIDQWRYAKSSSPIDTETLHRLRSALRNVEQAFSELAS